SRMPSSSISRSRTRKPERATRATCDMLVHTSSDQFEFISDSWSGCKLRLGLELVPDGAKVGDGRAGLGEDAEEGIVAGVGIGFVEEENIGAGLTGLGCVQGARRNKRGLKVDVVVVVRDVAFPGVVGREHAEGAAGWVDKVDGHCVPGLMD